MQGLGGFHGDFSQEAFLSQFNSCQGNIEFQFVRSANLSGCCQLKRIWLNLFKILINKFSEEVF